MTDMIPDITKAVEELERLEKAATPGRWKPLYDDNGFYYLHAERAPSPYIAATGGEGVIDEDNINLVAHTRNTALAYAKLALAAQDSWKYLKHDALCGIIGGYGYCTCGLDEVKASIAQAARDLIGED